MTININIGNPQGPAGPPGLVAAIPANTIVANATNATATPTGITKSTARDLLEVLSESEVVTYVGANFAAVSHNHSADNITSGTLAKARQHAQTPYKDESNVFTAPVRVASTLTTSGDVYFGDKSDGPYYADDPIWGTGQAHVRGESQFTKLRLSNASNSHQSFLAFDRSRGTFEDPQPILSGDTFVAILGVGLPSGGSTMEHGPQINFVTTENWATGTLGCAIDFLAIPNGSGSQQRVMRLAPGGVSIDVATTIADTLTQYTATSGSVKRAIALINQANAGGTGIKIDFTPNANINFPFGAIQVDRPSADIAVGFRIQTINSGTFSLTDCVVFNELQEAAFAKPISQPLTTPASASATGVAGTICADANYIYVCTATNTWKRVAIATW